MSEHRHAAAPGADEPGEDSGEAGSPLAPTPDQRRARRRAHLRAELLIGVLCAALGFAIVTQVRHTQEDEFASMRQDDLVRLLDEISLRNSELTEEQGRLRRDRQDLLSGADARLVAERNATIQGILAGTIPVEGPGVVLTITEGDTPIAASTFVHVLEELRNAGAEAIEVSGVRLAGSSWFLDSGEGLLIDGDVVESPYVWKVIGDEQTLSVALEIPGGALWSIRNAGAKAELESAANVAIESVRAIAPPEFATPAPPDAE